MGNTLPNTCNSFNRIIRRIYHNIKPRREIQYEKAFLLIRDFPMKERFYLIFQESNNENNGI